MNKEGMELFDSAYNPAQSDRAGVVNEVNEMYVSNHGYVPTKGKPNSVTIVRKNYEVNGDPYLDIDYDDHGNAEKHPVVPHQHHWHKDDDGNLIRGPWEDITK